MDNDVINNSKNKKIIEIITQEINNSNGIFRKIKGAYTINTVKEEEIKIFEETIFLISERSPRVNINFSEIFGRIADKKNKKEKENMNNLFNTLKKQKEEQEKKRQLKEKQEEQNFNNKYNKDTFVKNNNNSGFGIGFGIIIAIMFIGGLITLIIVLVKRNNKINKRKCLSKTHLANVKSIS